MHAYNPISSKMAQNQLPTLEGPFSEFLQPPTYESTARTPPNGGMGTTGKLAYFADSFLSGLSRGRAIAAAKEAQKQDTLYHGIYQAISQVQQSDAAQPVKDAALKQLGSLQTQVLRDALGGNEGGKGRRGKGNQEQGNHPGFHIGNAVRSVLDRIAGPAPSQPADQDQIVNTLNSVMATVRNPANSIQAQNAKLNQVFGQAYHNLVTKNGGKPPTFSEMMADPATRTAYSQVLNANGNRPTGIVAAATAAAEQQTALQQRELTAKAMFNRELFVQDREDARQAKSVAAMSARQDKSLAAAQKREETHDKAMDHRASASMQPLMYQSAIDTAQGIMNGTQPPVLTGLYRYGSVARGYLSKHGYNLMRAERDWSAVQAHIKTLNGAQMTRLMTALNSLDQMIPQLKQAYDAWQATGLPGGYKTYNKAALIAAAQGSGPSSAAAQKLRTLINDSVSEMSYVYMGGNSPTDHALKLAEENIQGNWNPQTFDASLGTLETNLRIRRNSVITSPVVGVSSSSPYVPKPMQGNSPEQAQPESTTAAPPPGGKLDPKVQSLLTKYQSGSASR